MDIFRHKAESASSDASPLCDRPGSKKRRHQLPRDCHGHARVAGDADKGRLADKSADLLVDHGKCEATEAAMVFAVRNVPVVSAASLPVYCQLSW